MPSILLYWITTLLSASLFAIPGVALIAGLEHFVSDMALLGYPSYFPLLLGVSKLAAVIVILAPGMPRLKEWAYAGMLFDAAAAIASRIAVEGGGSTLAIPAGIGLLTLMSWALRPASRRLGALMPAALGA